MVGDKLGSDDGRLVGLVDGIELGSITVGRCDGMKLGLKLGI